MIFHRFKVIEFADLDKCKVRLMKILLTNLLTGYPDYITKEVFSRIASLDKLETLREGLKLFMKHFLLKRTKGDESNIDTKVFQELKDRVEISEKALSVHENKMKM